MKRKIVEVASVNDESSDINFEDSSEEEEPLDDDEEDYEDDEFTLARRLYYYALSIFEDPGKIKSSDLMMTAIRAIDRAKSSLLDCNSELRKIYNKSKAMPYNERKVPPGSSQVQRTIENDRFILCKSSILAAKLHILLNSAISEIESELKLALVWFPRSIEANYLYAVHIKQYSKELTEFLQAEVHLSKAVAVGRSWEKDLEFKSRTLICDEDKDFELEEIRYYKLAENELILFLCQQGKFSQAIPYLTKLNYTWRLSKKVLCYDKPFEQPLQTILSSNATRPEYLIAIDNFLPVFMLNHLREVFRPQSPFWLEHEYDVLANSSKKVGYFSYLYPLKKRQAICSVEQVIDWVYRTTTTFFPEILDCNYAEWWTHSRPHCSGHQLHFDSDETALEAGDKPNHPLITMIVFLSGGIGGPTLVTDQVLGSNLATKGWLCHPKDNRAVIFNANVLHGVIPGRGVSPNTDDRRLSFMVGFWKDIKAKYRGVDQAGPGQPFPDSLVSSGEPLSQYSWHNEMKLLSSELVENCHVPNEFNVLVNEQLPSVWEAINDIEDKNVEKTAKQPSYNECFQGF